MTLNLNYYGDRYGAWSIRRGLICEAIRGGRPDIIAFQAVSRDPAVEGGKDQAAQIAGILPEYEYHFFHPAVESSTGTAQGSAVLSRIPWRKTGCQELALIPGLEDENRRVLLSAEFDLPHGTLNLFNGHFSWVPEQARMNVDEALRTVNSVGGWKILVGDLNCTPESGLLDPLAAEGWTDVWSDLRPQEHGFTFFEEGRLSKRIDYVWVNQELIPFVDGVRIAADSQHESGARVSDHAALQVALNLVV